MKKKILIVFTGGTICTTVKGNEMSTDPLASAALVEFFEKSTSPCKDYVELHNGKSFGILSENMTIGKWNEVIEYFQQELPKLKDFSGIVVAHGTDTLAYSAALFSLLLKGLSIPVFFVSSNYSIMREDGSPNLKANGVDNFRAAIECICAGVSPGVYATYRNPEDQRMYLHKGSRLTQCQIYDENFYSSDALDITSFNGVNLDCVNSCIAENLSELPIMQIIGRPLKDCVLKISPYVGLNYDMFDLTKPKAVLHGTYHSGTACVVRTKESPAYGANSILYLMDKCAENNVPLYLSPSEVGDGCTVYDSVPFIEQHETNGQRVCICYGETDELMYAKLLLAYSLDFEQKRMDALLEAKYPF